MKFTRRQSLLGMAAGAATLALGDIFSGLAAAEPFDLETSPLLLVCSFDGGWDQLLALDPRDATKYTSGKIVPDYDYVAGSDASVQQALYDTNGTGLVKPDGSAIEFGPAIGRLAEYYEELCVVRGINMGTLTHEVGRRYFLTGKFPRGLSASGSSLGTWHAHSTGDLSPIPNLVVGGEAYNEGLDNFATALQIRQSFDLLTVLLPLGTPLPEAGMQAVDSYLWTDRCADQLLDGDGAVTTFLDSRTKALTLTTGDLASHFQFTQNPSPEVKALYDAFGIGQGPLNQALNGPKGQALIAAQALTQGLSQAVKISLAPQIDHHDGDYQTDHAPALVQGFDALADLIGVLKSTKDATGKSFWERTTLLVTSDFARTPTINGRGGRDHHLASSCLLAGAGIRGNTVIGATDDFEMGVQNVDPATGAVDPGGVAIRPPDVHATLLSAMGLSYEHIDNQDPVLLETALT